jgi:hypothetical protein
MLDGNVSVNDGNAVNVTVAAGAMHRNAIAPIGLAPMFAGRRVRLWIAGVLPGCVVENVLDSVVATLPAGSVATLEYPVTAKLAVCEPVVDSDTCCDCEVTGVAVAVGFTLGATLEPPPPPPPPQADKTTLTVVKRAKKPVSVRGRILAYYRPASPES